MLTGFICGHSSEMQTAEQQQQSSHCANYMTLGGIWRTCTGTKMYYLLLYSVLLTNVHLLPFVFKLKRMPHIYNHPLSFLTEVKIFSQMILTLLCEP